MALGCGFAGRRNGSDVLQRRLVRAAGGKDISREGEVPLILGEMAYL